MNHPYRLYVESESLVFAIGQNWYRLTGDVWGADLRSSFPASSPAVTGQCAIRDNGPKQFAFTHPRGTFHILAESTRAYATAGHVDGSPKCSGTLEGQTGETAEERIRSFLLRES